MDRYSAVTEYRFDWRTEREPSCEDIVFWRETGMKDDEDDVDARDGACSIETAILGFEAAGCGVNRPREGVVYGAVARALSGRRQRSCNSGTVVRLVPGWVTHPGLYLAINGRFTAIPLCAQEKRVSECSGKVRPARLNARLSVCASRAGDSEAGEKLLLGGGADSRRVSGGWET
jgi:hypothetical protein